MEAYWVQYREHCLEQVGKHSDALESLRRQHAALVAADGNPHWIASLARDIADAHHALEVYSAVIARLDGAEGPAG